MSELTERFDREFSKIRSKLISEGVPERLINKGERMALHYIRGVVDTFFDECPPEEREKLYDLMINDGIKIAEKWINGIMSLTSSEKKLREVI